MRRRNAGDKVWKPENITASDLEKVICNGIPINKMGNLKKDVGLYPGETFQSEAIQQTENYQYSESQISSRAALIFLHWSSLSCLRRWRMMIRIIVTIIS